MPDEAMSAFARFIGASTATALIPLTRLMFLLVQKGLLTREELAAEIDRLAKIERFDTSVETEVMRSVWAAMAAQISDWNTPATTQ